MNAEMKESRREIWAVTYERIERFFMNQPDVEPSDEGFMFGSCIVRITSMDNRKLGSLSFPQTEVSFDGCSCDLEKLYERFRMNFISAGG